MARSRTPKLIPLRLRRRRDGTLALTDAAGAIDGPDRAFPAEHVFGHDWLIDNGAAVSVDGDQLTVELVNGTATYTVVDRGPGGLRGELTGSDLFDAPPVEV